MGVKITKDALAVINRASVSGDFKVAGKTTVAGIHNTNIAEGTGTSAEIDLTSTAKDLVWYANTVQAGEITLPQATAANAGMRITIIVGTASWSTTPFKMGFANGGSTVMCGQLYLSSLNGNDVEGFTITAGAKSFQIDADAVATAGGAIGSQYVFTYLEADLVHCMAHGMITTGTAAPDATASTTTGT